MLLTCHTNRAAVLLQALLLAPLCLAAEPYRDPFTSQTQPLQPVDNQAILPPRPLSSLSVPINHSNLAQLLTIVQTQNLLSAQGKAFIDERTHSLIIRDHAQQFNEIKQLVAQLDKPQPPIHIAAHIVTINSESLAELGVRWSYLGGDSQFINKYNINLGVGSPTGLLGINIFKHAGHILNLELSALETEN